MKSHIIKKSHDLKIAAWVSEFRHDGFSKGDPCFIFVVDCRPNFSPLTFYLTSSLFKKSRALTLTATGRYKSKVATDSERLTLLRCPL